MHGLGQQPAGLLEVAISGEFPAKGGEVLDGFFTFDGVDDIGNMGADVLIIDLEQFTQVLDGLRPALGELFFDQTDGFRVVIPQQSDQGVSLEEH